MIGIMKKKIESKAKTARLADYEQPFIETEIKGTAKVRKTVKKASKVITRGKRPNITILTIFNRANTKFNNVVNKIKHPRQKARNTVKIDRELAKQQRNRGILGIGQLLVVVSIIYSTAVVSIGVDSQASKIALFPQSVFALIILTKAFSKLYK